MRSWLFTRANQLLYMLLMSFSLTETWFLSWKLFFWVFFVVFLCSDFIDWRCFSFSLCRSSFSIGSRWRPTPNQELLWVNKEVDRAPLLLLADCWRLVPATTQQLITVAWCFESQCTQHTVLLRRQHVVGRPNVGVAADANSSICRKATNITPHPSGTAEAADTNQRPTSTAPRQVRACVTGETFRRCQSLSLSLSSGFFFFSSSSSNCVPLINSYM